MNHRRWLIPAALLVAALQIGVLGWMIVIPMLLGVALGRWLDKFFDSGLFFSAPAILIGAGLGLYSAWRWMQRQ